MLTWGFQERLEPQLARVPFWSSRKLVWERIIQVNQHQVNDTVVALKENGWIVYSLNLGDGCYHHQNHLKTISSSSSSSWISIKNWMGPYQRTPKKVARVIRYPGFFGVRSFSGSWVLFVGDFLENIISMNLRYDIRFWTNSSPSSSWGSRKSFLLPSEDQKKSPLEVVVFQVYPPWVS